MRRATANTTTRQHLMWGTGLAVTTLWTPGPNAAQDGVASVAQGIQQHKFEPEPDNALGADNWLAIAHALLHPIS